MWGRRGRTLGIIWKKRVVERGSEFLKKRRRGKRRSWKEDKRKRKVHLH